MVRKLNKEARKLADHWFFETLVRVHRAGEGAPYTGLKPAGLDQGPAVPRAERAIERGDASQVVKFLTHTVEEELQKRFKKVLKLRDYEENDVEAAREYVEAMLGFILFAHKLYLYLIGENKLGTKEKVGHEH